MTDTSNPRHEGRQAIQSSVPPEIWQANERFSKDLLRQVETHPIARHPLIALLDQGIPDLEAQRYFHLEFRHAFAQIFTDLVIHAMASTSQLEQRLGALGKVSARFLLQLNLLDELGFQPQVNAGDYAGSPFKAHYLEFDATLRELGLAPADLARFVPSAEADACRRTFSDNYGDHCLLTCVLAVSETVFTRFAGAWAKSVGKRTGIDVSQGYHSIHVEHDGSSIDDDHSEDAWYVFRQAVTPDRYDDVLVKTNEWLDTWAAFLDHLMAPARAHSAEHV